ncbi:adenylate kinase family protein [Vampirovibrio sp.]|uniref:adenylate kinase family protein n=1 Tax=Vampirovibrio sp. TaxID=2717857 RepID=UPI0035935B93
MTDFSKNLKNKLLFPFVAPPNGGKGTQTQILSERYHLPTFDMGSTFRAIMKEGKDPELKAELESYMNNGKLVPIKTVVKVFQKGLEALAADHSEAKGFILDGFPRNQEQADALLELCQHWEAELSKAIYLNVSLDIVKARATGRRFCSENARHVYNVNDECLAPKQQKISPDGSIATDQQGRAIGLCDIDQAELIVRTDDEPQTVEKRLAEYQKETNPLIEHLQEKGYLAEINGEQAPEKVTLAIESLIQPILGLSTAS